MSERARRNRGVLLYSGLVLERIDTTRLVGTRICEADWPDFLELFHDARVMATLGGPQTDEWIRSFFDHNVDHWKRHGYGLWMFRERDGERFAGRAGIRRCLVDARDEVELGYTVRFDRWGRGYATEMSAGILKLAFGEDGLDQVVAFTLHTNLPSRRVMEKLGFVYEKDIVHKDLPHVMYRLGNPGRPL